jgi:hypothetical protein
MNGYPSGQKAEAIEKQGENDGDKGAEGWLANGTSNVV